MQTLRIFILLLLFNAAKAQTDFINDNVLYKNLYPSELSLFLKNNPDATLIDVRSPGEFSDTSRYGSLNIGRIRNAINIPIDSIDKQQGMLETLKEKPLILYCSHSQRSRRVSKKLREKGFRKVYNLNAGMSWMNQAGENDFPGKAELLVNNLPYKNVRSEELEQFIKQNSSIAILDVRSENEFNSMDSIAGNNQGRIRNAINVPWKDKTLDTQKLPKKGTDLLVYDLNGALSHHAALWLLQNGYKNVYNLQGGILGLVGKVKESSELRNRVLESVPAYKIINSKEAMSLIIENDKLVVLDIRPADEFNNQGKNPWQRLGRIKGAENIQPDSLNVMLTKYKDKQAEYLIYGGPNAASAARTMTENGYKNAYFLNGGLWEMVYLYANVDGYRDVKEYLENYEGLY